MLLVRSVLRRRRAAVAALFGVLGMTACSGGGGGDDDVVTTIWGRLRRDAANSGVGSGVITNNPGTRRVLVDVGQDYGGLSDSSPVIGLHGTLYIGTQAGLLTVDPEKEPPVVMVIVQCNGHPIGPVNGTPAVTVNGDIVFGNDAGTIFRIHDDGRVLECDWMFPSAGAQANGPVRSSPIAAINSNDRRLTTVVVGIGGGRVLALNGNGTEQWRFQSSDPSFGPLTSSPASDGSQVYVAAPDGFLYAIDLSGDLRWRAAIGIPQPDAPLLASPTIGTAIYATGVLGTCEPSGTACTPEAGQVTAFHIDGTFQWRFDSLSSGSESLAIPPIPGSPVLAVQSVDEPAPPTPSVPPTATPTGTLTPSVPPTPTRTRFVSVLQDVVYVVDGSGTVYALKGATGEPFHIPPPERTSTPTHTPTPTPIGGVSMGLPPEPGGQGAGDQEDTGLRESVVRLNLNGAAVTTSPVVSSDLFIVFGTSDGRLYAVRVDYDRTAPCTDPGDCTPKDPGWQGALDTNDKSAGASIPVALPPVPIRSSPVIGGDGTIYVTADDGLLYAIGEPP